MTFWSRKATVILLAFVVIEFISNETNAKPPARIMGGKDARIGDFPWIITFATENSRENQCGGAIIGPQHILTAGHCIARWKSEQLLVRSGIVDLDDPNFIESRISRLIVHPAYEPWTPTRAIQNDIGIVVLKEKLRLGGRLRALDLPTHGPGVERATVSGWGEVNPFTLPRILQTAEVHIIDDKECRNTGIPVHGPQYICGYQKTGNTRGGDSGSPLFSGREIIGVVSSGYGNQTYPDFYANVYHYLDWIKTVVRQTSY